jgi:hypothetical protein
MRWRRRIKEGCEKKSKILSSVVFSGFLVLVLELVDWKKTSHIINL